MKGKKNIMQNKIAMFLLGATLAFGLALSAYIIGQAAVKVSKNNNIRVKGSAMREVESDFAHWSGTYSVRNASQQVAIDQLENAKKNVEKYLFDEGISKDEISFGRIYSEPMFETHTDAKGNRYSKFVYYQLKQSVFIASKKVYKVEKISRESTLLIKKGFGFSSDTPSYTILDLDKFKMELLAEATKNASDRAEILAKNAKGKVGSLIHASQGVFQITAPASSDISSYGEYDKTTIKKEVKAVVTLEFTVETP